MFPYCAGGAECESPNRSITGGLDQA